MESKRSIQKKGNKEKKKREGAGGGGVGGGEVEEDPQCGMGRQERDAVGT